MSRRPGMQQTVRCRRPLALAILAAGTASAVTKMPDPCTSGSSTTGSAPDHSVLTQLLRGVTVNGSLKGVNATLVNYDKIRREPPLMSLLQRYMLSLCSVNVAALSQNAKLALYANAYNALMISMVVHYKPGITVKEISDHVSSSVWKEVFVTVAGEKVSLDTLEHVKIRGGLSRAMGVSGRIHAMVVCASLSCPDIQREAFEESTVVAQATGAMRRWLLNPTKNPGPDGNGNLILSKIFDWYGGDFVQESGSIQAFVRAYTPWTTQQVPDAAPIAFLPYNWDLNAVNASGVSTSGTRSAAAAGGLAAALVLAAAIYVWAA